MDTTNRTETQIDTNDIQLTTATCATAPVGHQSYETLGTYVRCECGQVVAFNRLSSHHTAIEIDALTDVFLSHGFAIVATETTLLVTDDDGTVFAGPSLDDCYEYAHQLAAKSVAA